MLAQELKSIHLDIQMGIMDILTNPKFLVFIPKELKKLTTGISTPLRLMGAIMEYGGVRIWTPQYSHGLLAPQIKKDNARVLEQTSNSMYVPRASLGTLGGFIMEINMEDGLFLEKVLL